MTKKRVAINGFGRIGRLTFKYLQENPNIEVVAINDLTNNATMAHLLKYDSTQGQFQGSIDSTNDALIINGKRIAALSERDPAQLPWKELDVDIVLESTGVFRDRVGNEKHLSAGAERVILSVPGKGDIKMVVLGINDDIITSDDKIISNASCTTNCLAPMAKVLHENFGIEYGFMTTVHAYTADQRLQDAPHKDLRRARAAALSMIPTTTGAAVAVTKVMPELEGKLNGAAIRVPTPTGSLTDLCVVLQKDVDVPQVNAAMKEASESGFKGIVQYTEEPLVSVDIVGNPHSVIFDAGLSAKVGNMIRVVGWYDNEAGYSARTAELIGML